MSGQASVIDGPHQGQPVLRAGAELASADAAMILLHGRGASARDILTLAPELANPRFTYLAPQAANGTWYPYGFMAPIDQNEPGISSGLQVVHDLLSRLDQNGLPASKIIILGFSQGACLALEFVARHARRYGGVAGLSGGLIGPPKAPRDYSGSLAGTPVFLGCSDSDFHIPKERVQESGELLQRLGGEVTVELYHNMGHEINENEILNVRTMMNRLTKTN